MSFSHWLIDKGCIPLSDWVISPVSPNYIYIIIWDYMGLYTTIYIYIIYTVCMYIYTGTSIHTYIYTYIYIYTTLYGIFPVIYGRLHGGPGDNPWQRPGAVVVLRAGAFVPVFFPAETVRNPCFWQKNMCF